MLCDAKTPLLIVHFLTNEATPTDPRGGADSEEESREAAMKWKANVLERHYFAANIQHISIECYACLQTQIIGRCERLRIE